MRVSIGSHVIFTDENFWEHDALVTAIWGDPDKKPTINLLYVSGDESKTDQYGRQIERPTSIQHAEFNSAGGYCWRFPSEDRPRMGEVIK
jgi:hypothetical protein